MPETDILNPTWTWDSSIEDSMNPDYGFTRKRANTQLRKTDPVPIRQPVPIFVLPRNCTFASITESGATLTCTSATPGSWYAITVNDWTTLFSIGCDVSTYSAGGNPLGQARRAS